MTIYSIMTGIPLKVDWDIDNNAPMCLGCGSSHTSNKCSCDEEIEINDEDIIDDEELEITDDAIEIVDYDMSLSAFLETKEQPIVKCKNINDLSHREDLPSFSNENDFDEPIYIFKL